MHHTHQPMPLDRILRESWQAVKGVKWPFFVTFLALMVLQLIIYFINMAFTLHITKNPWLNDIFDLLLSASLLAPLLTGLLMLGVARSRGITISWSDGFQYYQKLPQLFIAFFMGALILWITFMVFGFLAILLLALLHISFNVYFHLSWITVISALVMLFIFVFCKSFLLFNFILVIDKGINPFIAWWHSCKMTAPHYGKIFLSLIYLFIFNILGLCLLGVGLIWTVPWTCLVVGRMYLFCEYDRERPDLIEE
jgi:hypothetical protein